MWGGPCLREACWGLLGLLIVIVLCLLGLLIVIGFQLHGEAARAVEQGGVVQACRRLWGGSCHSG